MWGWGAEVGSSVWLQVGREGSRKLWSSWGLDQEEPLHTLGFFGCKLTLANFSQEGHLQEGGGCR